MKTQFPWSFTPFLNQLWSLNFRCLPGLNRLVLKLHYNLEKIFQRTKWRSHLLEKLNRGFIVRHGRRFCRFLEQAVNDLQFNVILVDSFSQTTSAMGIIRYRIKSLSIACNKPARRSEAFWHTRSSTSINCSNSHARTIYVDMVLVRKPAFTNF